jgi:DNA ligase (NAD+)
VAWYCVNAACPAQLQRNLEHFVARGNMDIVGLGGRIVEKLIEASAVADVADIFSLTKKDILDALTKRDRKTESKPPGRIAENLLAAIQASRQQALARLISALGIRGVGGTLAADLARAFPDLDAISRASPDALMSIEGIGPNSAEAIVDWFTRPANKKVLRKLKKLGVWPSGGPTTETRGAAGRQLADLTFVITGTLPGFSREQATEFVETRGGKVVGSVSRATDYVVLGENAGSKLKKAQEYGIRLISEAELRSLAGAG